MQASTRGGRQAGARAARPPRARQAGARSARACRSAYRRHAITSAVGARAGSDVADT
jgi:hypothetical protein